MRVVFKIALGLFLFNVVFSLMGPIFSSGYEYGARGLDDEEVSQLDISSMGPFDYLKTAFGGIEWVGGLLGLTGLFTGIAVVGAFITKNYIFIGLGLFMGLLTGIFIRFMSIISQLGTAGTGGNIYVTGIITITGIAVGLLLMFNVVDMFAPAPS